jgi:hypothetical protein
MADTMCACFEWGVRRNFSSFTSFAAEGAEKMAANHPPTIDYRLSPLGYGVLGGNSLECLQSLVEVPTVGWEERAFEGV